MTRIDSCSPRNLRGMADAIDLTYSPPAKVAKREPGAVPAKGNNINNENAAPNGGALPADSGAPTLASIQCSNFCFESNRAPPSRLVWHRHGVTHPRAQSRARTRLAIHGSAVPDGGALSRRARTQAPRRPYACSHPNFYAPRHSFSLFLGSGTRHVQKVLTHTHFARIFHRRQWQRQGARARQRRGGAIRNWRGGGARLDHFRAPAPPVPARQVHPADRASLTLLSTSYS